MARDHGRIKTSVWRDQDWRDLSANAQWLYLAIVTQEGLSRCGVLDWRPGRIAALGKGMTAAKVERAARELEAARFLLVDRQTEEALARSFVRHDGVLDRVNMGKAVGRALAKVYSQPLRTAILAELARAYVENPGLAGWNGIAALFPDDFAEVKSMASAMQSGMPSPMASSKASVKA